MNQKWAKRLGVQQVADFGNLHARQDSRVCGNGKPSRLGDWEAVTSNVEVSAHPASLNAKCYAKVKRNMSILLDYHRLSPSEREKVTHNQATWERFKSQLLEAQSRAMRNAMAKVKVDDLSAEERIAKIGAAIEQSRDPRHFNLEKDWHILAYLLTGDARLKEEHLPNAPSHNVIFGGLKTSVSTGYGPVRYFDGKFVAESAAALAGANRKVIASRYDPAAMRKLDIHAPPEESEKKAVLQVVEGLTAFFQSAAAAHEDVIKFAS